MTTPVSSSTGSERGAVVVAMLAVATLALTVGVIRARSRAHERRRDAAAAAGAAKTATAAHAAAKTTTGGTRHEQPMTPRKARVAASDAPLATPDTPNSEPHHTTMSVVLRRRPPANEPVSEQCFEVVTRPIQRKLRRGQVRLRLLVLSVDPYQRCMFNKDPGADYLTPYQLNEPLWSGGVCCVIESAHPKYRAGTYVASQMHMKWQEYIVADPDSEIPDLEVLPEWSLYVRNTFDARLAISFLGMPGLSAFHAVTEQCKPAVGTRSLFRAAPAPWGRLRASSCAAQLGQPGASLASVAPRKSASGLYRETGTRLRSTTGTRTLTSS